MKVIGVIPARYHSIRLDGKALADINGQPMVQHVWKRAQRAKLLDRVILATDDRRIEMVARGFGAEVIMTSQKHLSGTDRTAEAVGKLDCDVVVNIQGDEPMIDPSMIDELIQVFSDEPHTQLATLAQTISEERVLIDPNVVKVVVDLSGNAMYFSRSTIPYRRSKENAGTTTPLKHIGIYAYKKTCLQRFTQLPQSGLEKTENLEQLRALENGISVRVVPTRSQQLTFGVDSPGDLATIRKIMKDKS